MMTLLHIDASARRTRSHTRHLSKRFVDNWRTRRPVDEVIVRDVGADPPPPVTEAWVAAAFAKPEQRTAEMTAALAVSDRLIDELERADIVVAGVPMYNFGVPAPLKAYIDNIVRVGRTFGFDRTRVENPYWPILRPKPVIILSARGDYGYDAGQRIAHVNHVEPYLREVLGFIGLSDVTSIAVEYDEFRDERFDESLRRAEAAVDHLVIRLTEGIARAA
ncbi:MAG TPA: NAD(P)H-dependent oxidoreductase [Alphaproteobacteria bacterium]|nr:NAD(P)H-dependent oxidoreductase [Alphaproteobacteria bacterium]